MNSVAGWSSLVARWAHNPKVASSNLAPATNIVANADLSRSAFCFGAPGRAHLLGGGSPLRSRQGEPLAERQGCLAGDCESEESRRQSAGLTNRKRMRRRCGVRRPISSKPGTGTERNDVDPTGISVKVSAQYPRRSAVLPERATGVERRGDGAAEVSRGQSRCAAHRSAEHDGTQVGPMISMDDEEAQARALRSDGADTPRVADAGGGGGTRLRPVTVASWPRRHGGERKRR